MSRRSLSIRNLRTSFFIHVGEVEAVRGISFDVNQGEVLGTVRESGSGKSVTSLSTMGLLQYPSWVVDGEIFFQGQDTLSYGKRRMHRVRGKEIAMIFQGPMTSLSPVYTVGSQTMEMPQEHEDIGRDETKRRAIEMLRMVGAPSPEKRIHNYPRELSGDMCQRATIAITLACNPKLLTADGSTTTLDVTIQVQVLNLIKRLNQELDIITILITHDLGMMATLCDKVVVMYGGLTTEDDVVEEILYHPEHPYITGLTDSVPRVMGGEKQRLRPTPGTPPNLTHSPRGRPFSTRCPYYVNVCMEEMPPCFQEGGHWTMRWLLYEEALVNPGYVQRRGAMRRADG